ncbi:MAG TPA: SMC family ATPase, partial [Thiothrix sp.]|nr:SMC family ATPase [Thiothrix sp.]
MRPIKLSMTAFGPFVDTQTIDFEALGEKPLFLINGATGSGKTTILDGICFALYGQTTGKEREAGQMRCDYADDKKLTAVEFEFELADTCYRIKRIPEQQRAKAKGEGTTRQAAEAQLYRLDGDDEILLVARKVSDATKEIENLTGLQVDQFRQVMVLPQGQFRRLLMADSKDRESIFSQLFETHIYKRIEDKLKAQAKKVYIEVAKLRDNQQGVLDSAGVESVDQLMQMINTLKPECKQAAQQAEAHDKQYVALLKGFEKATALATEFDQLQKQQHQLELLEQQKEAIQGNKDQLSKAELALKISPCYNDLTRLRTS